MTSKIQPVGNNILLKIEKKKSALELLPGTQTHEDPDRRILVEGVGSSCGLGLKEGDSVIVGDKLSQAILLEQTEDYDLILVQENVVKAIKP